MRHNRKAVMTEQYKLYLKKTIFNGKYFVRNMQIVVCMVLLVGIVTCVLAITGTKNNEKVAADTEVNVKDALFGTEEVKSEVVTKGITENLDKVVSAVTEESVTEQEITEDTEVLAADDNTPVKKEKKAKKKKKKEKKSEFDQKCIANVEETLNVRSEADSSSDFVGSMNPGAIATVIGTEGDWTKIKSGDVEGYVLSEYILTGKMAEQIAVDYVTLQGTILEDGVNIRTEKSTTADIVTILNKDDKLRVIEEKAADEEAEKNAAEPEQAVAEEQTETVAETTDEITWLSVQLDDGRTGYVSADFVAIDKLYELAVSAEELQRRAAEEEAARIAAAQEAARQAAAKQALDKASDEYRGATTTPVKAAQSGDCLGTFKITAYCGCKKCCNSDKTATGTTCTEGRTIAADTSVLPYGTQVVIDGIVYTVEDCGSAVRGNTIDIYFATHKKAISFGVKYVKVYKY